MAHAKVGKESSWQPWIVWGCGAIFFIYQFVLRFAPSLMSQELMQAFSITASSLGALSSSWYVAYTLAQLPLGFALDKFGPRRLFLVSAGLCILGTMMFATSGTFWVGCTGRFLLGLGSACGFLGTIKIATVWFNPRILPLIVGITCFLGPMSGVVTSAPLTWAVRTCGWREVLYGSILFGFILFIFIFKYMIDKKEEIDKETQFRMGEAFRMVFGSNQVWLLGLYSLCSYLPLSVLADLWGKGFIKTSCGVTDELSAFVSSLIYLSYAIGAVVIGWIVKSVPITRGFFIYSSALMTGFMTLAIWVHSASVTYIATMFALLGFASAAKAMVFPVACAYTPMRYSGVTVGFVNMLTMLGGSIFQPVVGYVMDMAWRNGGVMTDGVPVYTAADYREGLSILILVLFIGTLVTLFIKTPPRSRTD